MNIRVGNGPVSSATQLLRLLMRNSRKYCTWSQLGPNRHAISLDAQHVCNCALGMALRWY